MPRRRSLVMLIVVALVASLFSFVAGVDPAGAKNDKPKIDKPKKGGGGVPTPEPMASSLFFVGVASAGPAGDGYWSVTDGGEVQAIREAADDPVPAVHGEICAECPLNAPVVGIAGRPNGDGYWLAAGDGGVFAFGGAAFHGSLAGVQLNAPIVGVAARPDGAGYWLVGRDGGIFSFNAPYHGRPPSSVSNIVAIAAAPDNPNTTPYGGYWLLGSDGHVYAFGDAVDYGWVGVPNDAVGIAPTSNGGGYWIARAGGAVEQRGNAADLGDVGPMCCGFTYRGIVAKRNLHDGFHLIGGNAPDFPGREVPKAPIGSIIENSSTRVAGKAVDPNTTTRSVTIVIKEITATGEVVRYQQPTPFFDGGFNAQNGGISGNHRFEWTVPTTLNDGQSHTIEVWAIDTDGVPGKDVLLNRTTWTAPTTERELHVYYGDYGTGAPEAAPVVPFEAPPTDPEAALQPSADAPAGAIPAGTVTARQAATGQPSEYEQAPVSNDDSDVRAKCLLDPPEAAKSKEGWVFARQRMCQLTTPVMKAYKTTVTSTGIKRELVMEARWQQIVIGRGSDNSGSRKVSFTVEMTNWSKWSAPGYNVDLEQLAVEIACNAQVGSVCQYANQSEHIRTVWEWSTLPPVTFELTSPEAGSFDPGGRPEALSLYDFRITDRYVLAIPGEDELTVLQNEFRCDSAEYFRQPGCIFNELRPTFDVSLDRTTEDDSARHIYDAQFYPESTWPKREWLPEKKVPGAKESGSPLTRDRDTARQDTRHSTAVATCLEYDPTYKERGGLDCDEYPFKSTFQGADPNTENYSACTIDLHDNRSVGGRLAGFYNSQRIIHEWDPFWVAVLGTRHGTPGCNNRVDEDFGTCAPNCPTEPMWNPARWTTTSNNSSKTVDIVNGEGQLYVNGSSVRATAAMDPVADSEASLRYRFSDRNAQSAFRVTLRGSGGSGPEQLTTGYRLEVRSDTPTVKVQKIINGTVTTLTTVPYTQTTDDQWLRFEVKGSTIRARLWPATAMEPSGWLAEITDTSVTDVGIVQLAHSYTSGEARSVFVDDITILQTAPGGEITAAGWSAGHNDVASSVSISKPTGIAAGDVLIAGVATRGTPTVTPPTGWELIRTREEGSSWTLQSYYKIAGTSEPTDYSWGLSVAKAAAGTITAYSGVDTTNPIDVSSGQINSTASTSITAPSVTTTVDYAMLVGLFVNDGAAAISPPTDMTERGEDSSNAPSQAHVTIESADVAQLTIGASGDKTATAAAANRTAAELIALRPATSVGYGSGAGAITIAGWEAGQNDVASNLVLPKPAATTTGDVLIAAVAVRGVPTVTAPTGWTLIRSDSNGSSMKTLSYWRVATGSEPADYTWTFSSVKAAAGTIAAYTGVNTTNPVDVHSGFANTSDSSQILAPSVTTTEPNERLIGIFSIMKVTGIAPPTGMQELAETSASNGTDPPVTIEIADATQAIAEATGDKTATAGTADRNTGQLIALRPASSGPA